MSDCCGKPRSRLWWVVLALVAGAIAVMAIADRSARGAKDPAGAAR